MELAQGAQDDDHFDEHMDLTHSDPHHIFVLQLFQ